MTTIRRTAAGVGAIAVLLACLAATTAIEDPKREVKISSKDYCNSCMAIVELFFAKTAERAEEARKRFGADANVEGTEMMHGLCKDPLWNHYKESVGFGCLKVLHEYTAEVFGAFNGKHTLGDIEEIYQHKLTVCPNIGACKRHGMVHDTLEERTECGACEAIAKDIEYLVDREKSYSDAKRLKTLVSSVCDDLGLRHTDRSKAFLEDYCDEIMEEIGLGTIAGTIKLRKSMEGGTLRLSQTFPQKMCSDLSDYCPKPEEKAPQTQGTAVLGEDGETIEFKLD